MKKVKYIIVSLIVLLAINFAYAQQLPTLQPLTKPISQMSKVEIQTRISQILAVIQQLQTLLTTLRQSSGSSISRIPQEFSFSSNFKLGASSQDAKYLQIILNQDPSTQVSQTGAGSPGNESSYYGLKTQQAVIKFKLKYKLGRANAIIGDKTAAKLNELLNTYRNNPSTGSGSPAPSGSSTSCGNGIIETPNLQGTNEVCDTNQLNSQTCAARGYASGTLTCSNDCLTFNTSNCQRASGSGGTNNQAGGGTAVNRAPILNAIGNKTTATNNSFSFTIQAADQDNDTLTYSASNLPNGASFNNSTRAFSWTPNATGTHSITFTVSDGTLTDTETITLTVSNPPIPNSPPTANNRSVSADEDNPTSITLSATDPNSNNLTYSVLTNPSHGTITGTLPSAGSGQDPILTYTPNANYNGTDSFTFRANDGQADSNTATVSITVSSVNDAPILASIGSKSANENQALSFTITATDIDNSTLTYSTQNLPTGASFNNTTRAFSWTPSYSHQGTYNITFIVSDGELTDTETITLTVNDVIQACVPTTCLAQGKNCGTISDECSATLNCGTCSTGYSCNNNVCIQDQQTPTPATSCNQDSDCAGNGPGFICNANDKCEWIPPIGIPKPTFGIEETYRMYDDPANRNPALTYTQNSEGGYYTHYVDNTHPNATDGTLSNPNPYGTVMRPRLTVPSDSLPEGSVAEVNGGPYSYGGVSSGYHQIWFDGSGTPGKPVFIRTPEGKRAEIYKTLINFTGSYLIVENFDFNDSKVKDSTNRPNAHHIVFRNLDIYGAPAIFSAAFGVVISTDIVLYNNKIHDNGDLFSETENDFHSFSAGRRDNAHAERVWFVDNHSYRNSGDSIQLDSSNVYGNLELLANHIYIGRNVMHEDAENAIDLKTCKDIIISHNIMYGYRATNFVTSGSDGTPMVVNNNIPHENIWIIYNEIYDATNGIRLNDAAYAIGNVIHDIHRNPEKPVNNAGGYAIGTSGTSSSLYVMGNTIYNADRGIISSYSGATLYIYDNIIGLNDALLNSAHFDIKSADAAMSQASHNVFEPIGGQARIKWGSDTVWNLAAFQANTNQGDYCFEQDPSYVDKAAYNVHLQSNSPAVDKGTSSGVVQQVFDTFHNLYGIDIKKDIEENPRPQGNGWDIGAYESSYSQSNQCSQTDNSCGTYPTCNNCNSQDACYSTTYRDYHCSGASCAYTEYPNDSRCASAPECTSDQTAPCSTGLQGICSTGIKTCQTNGAWGSCVQTNQPVTEICNDNLDNDCDGTTDCSDTDCSAIPACFTTIPFGYISYWKFENNANDEKGVNNGTLYGNTTFINDSNKGNVASLDGSGDYVSFGDLNIFDNQSQLTISGWFKSNENSNTSGTDYMFQKQGGGTDTLTMNWNQNDTIVFHLINSSAVDAPVASSAITDWLNWHLMTFVYDGSYLYIYKDGNLICTPAAQTGTIYNSAHNFLIGATDTTSWNGLIDDVMIYNRALSASEIQAIYDAQKPQQIANATNGIANESELSQYASVLEAIRKAIEKLKELF